MTSEADPRTRTRWVMVGSLLALGTLVLVVTLALIDSAIATSAEGMRAVSFGWPLDWISQDQGARSPSFP